LKLAEILNVDEVIKPPLQTKKSQREAAKSKMPGATKNGSKLIRSFERQGLQKEEVKERFKDGKSFDTITPAYARIGLEILRRKKSVSKKDIRIVYEKVLGWSSTSAQSHVSIFVNAATCMGLVSDNGRVIEVIE